MIIGILNSGGDCPGINAVIEGYVSAAYRRGWRVIGFHDGFEGLLPVAGGRRYEILTPMKTHQIRSQGGTMLGTTNTGNFKTAGAIGIVLLLLSLVVNSLAGSIQERVS